MTIAIASPYKVHKILASCMARGRASTRQVKACSEIRGSDGEQVLGKSKSVLKLDGLRANKYQIGQSRR